MLNHHLFFNRWTSTQLPQVLQWMILMYGGHLVGIQLVEDQLGLVKWAWGSHHKMRLGLVVLLERIQLAVLQRLVVQAGLTQVFEHQLLERKALVLANLAREIQR